MNTGSVTFYLTANVKMPNSMPGLHRLSDWQMIFMSLTLALQTAGLLNCSKFNGPPVSGPFFGIRVKDCRAVNAQLLRHKKSHPEVTL